jgi:hypothetical protein
LSPVTRPTDVASGARRLVFCLLIQFMPIIFVSSSWLDGGSGSPQDEHKPTAMSGVKTECLSYQFQQGTSLDL